MTKPKPSQKQSILDEDGKLSSASKRKDRRHGMTIQIWLTVHLRRCHFTEVCESYGTSFISINRRCQTIIGWCGCEHSQQQSKTIRSLEAWSVTCGRESCLSCQRLSRRSSVAARNEYCRFESCADCGQRWWTCGYLVTNRIGLWTIGCRSGGGKATPESSC